MHLSEGWPEFLTRHVAEKRLTDGLLGEVSFGTTAIYRVGGGGRLSDTEEGVSSTRLRPMTGDLTIIEKMTTSTGAGLGNIGLIGFGPSAPAPISFSSNFNDYVLCLSNGPFNSERADAIRKMENFDLTRYIVYDSAKLRHAISLYLDNTLQNKDAAERNWSLVGQRVSYLSRAETLNLPLVTKSSHLDLNGSENWRKSTFHKPAKYSVEDEFRIVISIDGLGKLKANTPRMTFQSSLVQSAIVCNGTF